MVGDGWHRVLGDPILISNLSSILITLSFVNLLDDKETGQDSTLLIYLHNIFYCPSNSGQIFVFMGSVKFSMPHNTKLLVTW